MPPKMALLKVLNRRNFCFLGKNIEFVDSTEWLKVSKTSLETSSTHVRSLQMSLNKVYAPAKPRAKLLSYLDLDHAGALCAGIQGRNLGLAMIPSKILP